MNYFFQRWKVFFSLPPSLLDCGAPRLLNIRFYQSHHAKSGFNLSSLVFSETATEVRSRGTVKDSANSIYDEATSVTSTRNRITQLHLQQSYGYGVRWVSHKALFPVPPLNRPFAALFLRSRSAFSKLNNSLPTFRAKA